MKRALKYAISMPLILSGILILYIVVWSILYRRPPDLPETIDLRARSSDSCCYVILCAGLADNVCGFPGHCYAAWSESAPKDILAIDTAGFGPAHIKDQIPSLWSKVPGAVAHKAAWRNTRNLDALVIIVDPATYRASQSIEDRWRNRQFQTGVCDCVGFVNDIALSMGLNTPPRSFTFPQDYVRQLKALNKRRCTQSLAFQHLASSHRQIP